MVAVGVWLAVLEMCLDVLLLQVGLCLVGLVLLVVLGGVDLDLLAASVHLPYC